MSENQLPRTSSDASTPDRQNRTEHNISPEISPSDIGSPNSSQLDSEEGWESVDLPGTLNFTPATTEGILTNPPADAQEVPLSAQREDELLTLIHDLNECNDVLLARISQLESALATSQAVLETEAEKAKFAQNRLVQQVSAEQVSAQQLSHTAQQQVAQLVDQLDRAERSLSRQALINENLKTELNNAQERIVQLEKESALTLQQHADAAEAQRKAEAISRDLQSRLQRQQRYTLQFKAALEKSLTVSAARSTPAQADLSGAATLADKAASEPVPMPKAQRIMPWALGTTTAFTGIDPHLETLIRGTEQPAYPSHSSSHPLGSNPAAVNELENELEAEAELWQDLERVMSTEEETPSKTILELPAKIAESFATASKEPSKTISSAKPVTPTATVEFTEPSPWGKPLPETARKSKEAPKITAETFAETTEAETIEAETTEKANSTGTSPVMKEWRSPKRLTSLSAVQLPTFEKVKAGSFRR